MTLRFSETLWLWKWGISLLARSSMGRSGSGEREKRRAWLLQSRIRNLNFASSSPCGSSSTEIPLSSRMTYDCMLPVSFRSTYCTKQTKENLPGLIDVLIAHGTATILCNNQKLRSWANAVFQNGGVCLQAFPSPPPTRLTLHSSFLLSPHRFSRRTRAETRPTQAK